MTDTGIMRAVRDRLTIIRNSLGEAVPTITDEDGSVRAVAPNGRLVVAAGQTIASSWGNTTYDQSMQTFSSASDRTNQWPSPNEGALSFLVDSRTPWIFRSGAWHGLPMGMIVPRTQGPASQIDCGAAWTTVLTLNVPVVNGRSYRASASAYTQQQTATGAAQSRLNEATAGSANLFWLGGFAAGQYAMATGLLVWTATSTATTAVTLQGTSSAGVLRFAPGNSWMAVEDIGS